MSNKNNESNENVVSLRVAEAEQSDVGRKIARIDPDVAQQLRISAGDALELSSLGKKQLFCTGQQKKGIEERDLEE